MRIASLLAVSLLAVACGGSNPDAAAPASSSTPATSAAPAASGAPAAAADIKKPGDAKVGDKTTCPVSGEEFVVTADSPKADHNGKTYYFCCPGCDKKFKADPAKFMKGA